VHRAEWLSENPTIIYFYTKLIVHIKNEVLSILAKTSMIMAKEVAKATD